MNQDVMRELEKIERLTEGFRAKRKPRENKRSLVMNPGVKLTYWHVEAGRNTCGERVRFCVSDFANVAGYHLLWREVQKMSGTEDYAWPIGEARRHQFTAAQNVTRLKERARAKAEKFMALIRDIDARKKAGTMTYPRRKK